MGKDIERLAYSPADAARATSLSLGTIRRDIRSGTLRTQKRGNRRLILASDLKEYIGFDPEDRGKGTGADLPSGVDLGLMK
jgi:excisionase family DNA binding protein